jgi:N utilization substance protein A
LASKLVGWDIEIMTSDELDELIEKAVTAFTQIEGVDNDLAEKLVEQGILSYDDLSVMEIADLVNTIEGLTEEVAEDIRAKAEVLAEAQGDEAPRRKGPKPAAVEASVGTIDGSAESLQSVATELLVGGDDTDTGEPVEGESSDADLHDVELSSEATIVDPEVTSPPSNADQEETARIVTTAVESRSGAFISEAHASGAGVASFQSSDQEAQAADSPDEQA